MKMLNTIATKYNFSKQDIEKNYHDYLGKISFYKKLGFDHQQLRLDILKFLPIKISNILEVGTGKGDLTYLLAKVADENVISVDLDHASQRIAAMQAAYHNVLDKIEFYCADAKRVPFVDNFFEVVISSFSFHHFKSPLIVIEEMIRVSKDMLIITDFSKKGFELIEKAHRQEGNEHEHMGWDFAIVQDQLVKQGFMVLEYDHEWQKIYIAKKYNKEKI